MKNLIVIIVLLTTINVSAKDYYKTRIVFSNGETIEGLATLPSNAMFKSSIIYKTTTEGKTKKIKNNTIYQVSYYYNNLEYLFERNNYTYPYKSKKNKPNKKVKMMGGKFWFLVRLNEPELNVYNLAETYFFNNNNVLVSRTGNSSFIIDTISFLFKRPGEELPTFITTYGEGFGHINKNRGFRNRASEYFKDTPKLLIRIENKEFKCIDYMELAEAYISYQ
jgi:hypothetical protein